MANWTIFDQSSIGGSSAQNGTACPEVYPNVGTTPGITICQTICSMWDAGNLSSPAVGDTIACRINWALKAAMVMGHDADNSTLLPPHNLTFAQTRLAACAMASPMGGAAQVGYTCGSLQEFYCDVINSGNAGSAFSLASVYKCKNAGYANKATCVKDINTTLVSNGAVLSMLSPILTGDTIECRLSYALFGMNVTDPTPAAAVCSPAYWAGVSATNTSQCGTSICESFCSQFGKACGFGSASVATGGGAVYADQASCVTACNTFPQPGNYTNMYNGTGVSTAGGSNWNSVGCRRYHIANALNAVDAAGKATHCGHALWNSTTCTNVGAHGGAASSISPIFALIVALAALALATRL